MVILRRPGAEAAVAAILLLTRACLIHPEKDYPVGPLASPPGTSGEGNEAGAPGDPMTHDGGQSSGGSSSGGSGSVGLGGEMSGSGDGGSGDCSPASACPPRSCVELPSSCGTSMNDDCCLSLPVDQGNFTLGKDTKASVSAFSLDKYEVTVGRFRKFVSSYTWPPKAGSGAHPSIAASGWQDAWNNTISPTQDTLVASIKCDAATQTWSDTDENDALPMNCLNWYEAFAFCAWDGGRLPTEAEWEYVAKGGNESRWYPWGKDPIPSGFQDETTAYANYNCLGDGSADGACAFSDILRVGSKPMGVGKFGQLDLAGSIREWVLDWHNPLPTTCHDCANLAESTEKVTRGGDWGNATMYLSSDARLSNLPDLHYNFAGVRCARAL